jgi:hypothetical protein
LLRTSADEAVTASCILAGTVQAIRACIVIVCIAIIALLHTFLDEAVSAARRLTCTNRARRAPIGRYAVSVIAAFHASPHKAVTTKGSLAVSHAGIRVVPVTIVAFLTVDDVLGTLAGADVGNAITTRRQVASRTAREWLVIIVVVPIVALFDALMHEGIPAARALAVLDAGVGVGIVAVIALLGFTHPYELGVEVTVAATSLGTVGVALIRVAAIVALFREPGRRVDERGIMLAVTTERERAVSIAGGAAQWPHVALFILIGVAVPAHLDGETVGAAAIAGDGVAIVAHLTWVGFAVAAGLQNLAIATTAIIRVVVTVVADFIDIPVAISTRLVREAVCAATIPGNVVVVIADLCDLDPTIATIDQCTTIGAALIRIGDVAVVADFTSRRIYDAVTTSTEDADVLVRSTIVTGGTANARGAEDGVAVVEDT